MTFSEDQMQLLGFGLNFTLPHQKRNLIDFVTEMDERRKNNASDVGWNLIDMNLHMICQDLKIDFNHFVPCWFRLALKEI